MSEVCARAARRTERFTDHATMPRQARTASPINPRMAPTAIKTVPSGTFVVCMYGAFAVGGTVTTGPDVAVEEEDVESVVVETDDVDVLLDVDDDEDDEEEEEEEDVDVDDMLVEVEEVELEVDSVDEVDEDEEDEEVVLTLEVLSVVEEGSAVVLAASVVEEVVFGSFAGSAATRAAIARRSTKRKKNDGWALPSLRRKSLIVVSFPRSLCQCADELAVLHSGSAGVVVDQERKCSDKGISEFDIGALLTVGPKWAVVET